MGKTKGSFHEKSNVSNIQYNMLAYLCTNVLFSFDEITRQTAKKGKSGLAIVAIQTRTQGCSHFHTCYAI